MSTTDYADATDKEGAASRRRCPNRREVLDCGCPLPLLGRSAQPPNPLPTSDAPPRPKAPEDWRTPGRCRASVAPSPIRAIREIRGYILRALLLGALLLAGGAGAATRTVTNLADNGPGTLRQLIADASPGDTLDFAVAGGFPQAAFSTTTDK